MRVARPSQERGLLMGEKPFIKFFPSDFLGGTSGLSPAERGVYMTLLCLMYEQDGPIPRDDGRLARRCGAPKAAFIRSLECLIYEGKITDAGGMLSNGRAEKAIIDRASRVEIATIAANERWSAQKGKSKQKQGRHNANAMPEQCQTECQPEPEPDIKDNTNVLFKKPTKRATAIRDDWSLSERSRQDAIDRQFSAEEINHEANQFRDYHLAKGSTYKNWDAAWRTWLGNSRKFARGPANQSGRKNRGDIIADAVHQAGLRGFD